MKCHWGGDWGVYDLTEIMEDPKIKRCTKKLQIIIYSEEDDIEYIFDLSPHIDVIRDYKNNGLYPILKASKHGGVIYIELRINKLESPADVITIKHDLITPRYNAINMIDRMMSDVSNTKDAKHTDSYTLDTLLIEKKIKLFTFIKDKKNVRIKDLVYGVL